MIQGAAYEGTAYASTAKHILPIMAVARTWHAGQVDKCGEEYFEHCCQVADNCADYMDRVLFKKDTRIKAGTDRHDFVIEVFATAFLHDTLEDTDAMIYEEDGQWYITINEKEWRSHDAFGNSDVAIPEKTAHALMAITRGYASNSGETYKEYIKRCGENRIARLVKMNDIKHNTDPSRRPPGEEWEGMEKRYKWAINYLVDREKEMANSGEPLMG